MEYCVAVKPISVSSGDSQWAERGGDHKEYKSADAECDSSGLTIAAFTVNDCMNTTVAQKHQITYPFG